MEPELHQRGRILVSLELRRYVFFHIPYYLHITSPQRCNMTHAQGKVDGSASILDDQLIIAIHSIAISAIIAYINVKVASPPHLPTQ